MQREVLAISYGKVERGKGVQVLDSLGKWELSFHDVNTTSH